MFKGMVCVCVCWTRGTRKVQQCALSCSAQVLLSPAARHMVSMQMQDADAVRLSLTNGAACGLCLATLGKRVKKARRAR